MTLSKLRKGIYIERRKNTEGLSVIPITTPDFVSISMLQSNAAACTAAVRIGDKVKVGQLIGAPEDRTAVPVHSSVSGTVVRIRKMMSQLGTEDEHIVIKTDGKQILSESVVPPTVNSRESFITAVRNGGLIGLGKDGFPAHISFDLKAPGAIDTLIVNGAECEPFVTSDYTNMIAYARDVAAGALDIMKWLQIPRGIIAIQSDKTTAISMFKGLCESIENLEVCVLPGYFPAGEESIVTDLAARRQLRSGQSALDAGVLIVNISTALKLRQYLVTGMPLVSRTLTVDGDAVTNPMNVEVPIGTSLKDVLDFCGGPSKPVRKIIMGGPMTGTSVPGTDVSVIKTNSAMLCFSDSHGSRDAATACINCGLCAKNCPKGLLPSELYKAYKKQDFRKLKKFRIDSCIGCGCCSFVCPSRIQLSCELGLAKKQAACTKTETTKER